MIRKIERNGCIFQVDEERPFLRFGGGKGGGGKIPMPKVQAKKVTAAPVEQLSEEAKKNRKRAAAFQPRGFAPPTLGQAGLLGISGQ